MRHAIAWTAALLLLLPATERSQAQTALGNSTWSVEIGTDVGASDNASIGLRRHSGPSSAFRLGIAVNFENTDADGLEHPPTGPDRPSRLKTEFNSHRVSLQWMRFASIRDEVTATLAIGPTLQWSRTVSLQEEGIGLPSFQGFETRQSRTLYGLDLALGAEWFFNPRFSLGGQVGLLAMTGTIKQDLIQRFPTSRTERNLEGDENEIETNNGRIQLTAYF